MASAKWLSAPNAVKKFQFFGTSVLIHLGIFGVLALSYHVAPEYGINAAIGSGATVDVMIEDSGLPSDQAAPIEPPEKNDDFVEPTAVSALPPKITPPLPPSATSQAKESPMASAPAAIASSHADRSQPEGSGTVGMQPTTKASPSYLSNPIPPYPEAAKRRGVEGTVILSVAVDKTGVANLVEIEKSSGSRILDETAIKTVKRWKFKPATFAGVPVDSTAEVPITFRLTR